MKQPILQKEKVEKPFCRGIRVALVGANSNLFPIRNGSTISKVQPYFKSSKWRMTPKPSCTSNFQNEEWNLSNHSSFPSFEMKNQVWVSIYETHSNTKSIIHFKMRSLWHYDLILIKLAPLERYSRHIQNKINIWYTVWIIVFQNANLNFGENFKFKKIEIEVKNYSSCV